MENLLLAVLRLALPKFSFVFVEPTVVVRIAGIPSLAGVDDDPAASFSFVEAVLSCVVSLGIDMDATRALLCVDEVLLPLRRREVIEDEFEPIVLEFTSVWLLCREDVTEGGLFMLCEGMT